MNFIRDNIVKIGLALLALIILTVVVVACSGRKTENAVGVSDYTNMENKMQSAAIKFVNKNQSLLPKTVDISKKIQIDTLISNNLMSELHAVEDSNVVCTGYVEITKKSEDKKDYRYTPYIKCGKYYETKTIGNYIISNEEIVESGEGLYKKLVSVEEDESKADNEENNYKESYSYYFKGEYPNNYIVLGDRIYRIIEITEDKYLKVISTNKTYYSYTWDDRYNSEKKDYKGINNFEKSRIKDTLEFLYSNTNEDNGEIYFSDTEREYIVEHDFCTGKRSERNLTIDSESECDTTSSLKVGLIGLNDYYRVSTDPGCTSIDKQECNNYNYLFSINNGISVTYTTLIGDADDTYSYYSISSGNLELKYANRQSYLFPVIYINNNILYMSGSGTKEDPYIVR
jgi:predicted nucleic acid-binding Zn finger protein